MTGHLANLFAPRRRIGRPILRLCGRLNFNGPRMTGETCASGAPTKGVARVHEFKPRRRVDCRVRFFAWGELEEA